LSLKTKATVCQWFGLKTTLTVFSGLASKSVATVSPMLASKLVAGFLVEPQNQGYGLSVVWPQNHWDGFIRFGLKIGDDGFS
jgi:hypothetical protein